MSGLNCPVLLRLLRLDRKSTRLNSSHLVISYAVFCLKKKNYVSFYLAILSRLDPHPIHSIKETKENKASGDEGPLPFLAQPAVCDSQTHSDRFQVRPS